MSPCRAPELQPILCDFSIILSPWETYPKLAILSEWSQLSVWTVIGNSNKALNVAKLIAYSGKSTVDEMILYNCLTEQDPFILRNTGSKVGFNLAFFFKGI